MWGGKVMQVSQVKTPEESELNFLGLDALSVASDRELVLPVRVPPLQLDLVGLSACVPLSDTSYRFAGGPLP